MSREFFINGETLVTVKGGQHTSGLLYLPNTATEYQIGVGNVKAIASGAPAAELGLAVDQIQVTPRWKHRDFRADDFGPDVPPEVMVNIADVQIHMTLIHFDHDVLDGCWSEAMGGAGGEAVDAGGIVLPLLGQVLGAGALMGGGLPLLASGNHFISLNLLSPVGKKPYHFPAAYLTEDPVHFPLGTGTSAVALNWRAIPYHNQTGTQNPFASEIRSSGLVLWDYVPDPSS